MDGVEAMIAFLVCVGWAGTANHRKFMGAFRGDVRRDGTQILCFSAVKHSADIGDQGWRPGHLFTRHLLYSIHNL